VRSCEDLFLREKVEISDEHLLTFVFEASWLQNLLVVTKKLGEFNRFDDVAFI
jgi:hypothetical protein